MTEYTESHVLLTAKIKRWIRTVLSTEKLENTTRDQLQNYVTDGQDAYHDSPKIIPFRLIKLVYSILQKDPDLCLYLHELLEGSSVHLPQPQLPERDPKLEARIQKLRAEQSNRDYKEMTKNVDFKTLQEDNMNMNLGKEFKSVNRQMMTVLNFVLTVIGAFTFGYKATEYSLHTPNVAAQMATGLVFATVVFFADLYFIIKNDM